LIVQITIDHILTHFRLKELAGAAAIIASAVQSDLGRPTSKDYDAIWSIKVGSSLGARELFTRRDTGHACK
jgi:hypothetical protein